MVNTIRHNISKINETERKDMLNAIILLNTDQYHFPGTRDDLPFTGGVTYWFKQDEIHQATHVHGGPAFFPWHRELCNRFEKMLKMVNENIALHYWNWNEDPQYTTDNKDNPLDLFTDEFMGNANQQNGKPILAGEPWERNKFYDSQPKGENFRGTYAFDRIHTNPADPPIEILRNKQKGSLREWAKK